MTSQRESRKIVASIVGLGYSLGMITVAEGVETEEQADMLLWLGCELGRVGSMGTLCGCAHSDMVAAAPRTLSSAMSTQRKQGGIFSLRRLPDQRLAELRAIYDGSPVGLCFLDRIFATSASISACDMNGAPVAAHIGKTVGGDDS